MADVMTVLHECADYARWKPVFDADAPNRKAAGLTDLMLLRQQDEPNLLALIMGVSDRARANAMVASPELRETMRGAGIIGKPEVHLRQGDFSVRSVPLYLSINSRIRDIDTFRKGFAMDEADRVAASLTDLGVLVDIADPNDLLVVCSVGDQARVNAFLSSPTLAEHQVKNAGVTSQPVVRFWVPA